MTYFQFIIDYNLNLIVSQSEILNIDEIQKIIVNERKCDECDEKGFREYEGKFRCEKHHSEAKRIANIEFEKRESIKKYAVVVVGVIGIIVGSIVIYQFVANL